MSTKHKGATPGKRMAALYAVRRNNLRALIGKRFATQAELASALTVGDSYLTQLIGRKPIRRMTEVTARKFEYKLGLKAGALDIAG